MATGNLTNGKYPYRVAGIEMQIGNYTDNSTRCAGKSC